jgi:anti-sigma B factor antagonist
MAVRRNKEAPAVSELLSLDIESGTYGATVRVSGEIDISTAPNLRECLATLVDEPVVAVDLSDVAFVESSGLGVLIAEHKRRSAVGQELVITGSSPLARRVFEITGLDHVPNLDGDAPDA